MSTQVLELPRARTSRAWIFALITAAVAALAFRGAILDLVARWTSQEQYSHCFLIPLVTLWLLWTRRDALFASMGRPSWAGPAVILLAMFMQMIGTLSATMILSQLAFVTILLGIALTVGGARLFRVAFVPLAFLIFAIPLPNFIDANLSLQLQLVSSRLGVFFIRLFEIPVYLDGNVIDLGVYKLQVADACSGLRYLFPLLSLSFLAAYFFQAPIWQRALVLLSSIPITIAMNSLRIGLVGVTVDRWGSGMADGILHLFEGWTIFAASGLLLAGEVFLLARISGRDASDTFGVKHVSIPALAAGAKEAGGHAPLYACLLLICATLATSSLIPNRAERIPERRSFVAFPAKIGDWQGQAAVLDPQIEHHLGLDDYILSDYSRPDGKVVNLYVAYYSSQQMGGSPHSPSVCLPANGWSIINLERTSDGAGFPINRAIIERNGSRQLVYYWYQERGRTIASEWWSKWYLLYDTITKDRSDGALVRLITPILPGEVVRDADRRLLSFMQVLRPKLTRYLPAGDALALTSDNGTHHD
jgi:exosortase D (VPLPA-CTERM-specific)